MRNFHLSNTIFKNEVFYELLVLIKRKIEVKTNLKSSYFCCNNVISMKNKQYGTRHI
jgi:hypothetical protein